MQLVFNTRYHAQQRGARVVTAPSVNIYSRVNMFDFRHAASQEIGFTGTLLRVDI